MRKPDLYLAVSPSKYLKKGAPPTLILHGTIDDVVPIDQSDMLAKKLGELGVPYVYDRLEGWPHAMDGRGVNERCQWFMNHSSRKSAACRSRGARRCERPTDQDERR